jgi:tetratricopeptide (TPR) repeat protein
MLGLVVLALALCVAHATSPEEDAAQAQQLSKEGVRLAGARRLSQAIELFRQAVELDPTSPNLHNNLGVVYMRTNQMALAEERFVESLKLEDSLECSAASNLADLFAFTGQDADSVLAKHGVRDVLRQGIHEAVLARRNHKNSSRQQQQQQQRHQQQQAGASDPSLLLEMKQEETHGDVQAVLESSALRDAARKRAVEHVRHRAEPLPRIDAAFLHLPEYAKYSRGRAPFILTGVFEFWAEQRRRALATALMLPDAEAELQTALDLYAKGATSAAEVAAARYRVAKLRVSAMQASEGGGGGGTPSSWAVTHADWGMRWLASALGDAPADWYPQNLRTQDTPQIVSLMSALSMLTQSSGPAYIQLNLAAAHWYRTVAPRLGPLPPLFTQDEHWLDGCFGGAAADPDGLNGTDPLLRSRPFGAKLFPPLASLHNASSSREAEDASSKGHAPSSGGGANRGLVSEHFVSSHWRMLLVGNKGAGMFNHKDTLQTLSYQIQAQGGKLWHLCSPTQDSILQPLMPQFGKHNDILSLLDPDYTRFPQLLDLDCYADIVYEGEIVFYPREWWHETHNLFDYTVAITGTLAAPDNAAHVARELQNTCVRGGFRSGLRGPSPTAPLDFISPSADLCRHYARCAHWFEVAYGPSGGTQWERAVAAPSSLGSVEAADMVHAAERVRRAQHFTDPPQSAPFSRGEMAEAQRGQRSLDPSQDSGSVHPHEWLPEAPATQSLDTCLRSHAADLLGTLTVAGRSRSLSDARLVPV